MYFLKSSLTAGLSKRFWIIRFKNVIYKQQMFSHIFSEPKLSKIRPPDWILEHFLYQSESFWAVRFTGSLQIVREGRKLNKIGLKKQMENYEFARPY